MYTLYGDGVHDDYPAIQEMIDSGVCEVCLPVPKKHYLISKTLFLPSNFRLVLPRFAEIRLADGANCAMVRNKGVYKPAERLDKEYYLYAERRMKQRIERGDKMENCSMQDAHNHVYCFNYYVDEMSPEPEDANVNIELCGGIWNCNNLAQEPNPQRDNKYTAKGFTGKAMIFYNVQNLKITSLTVKDPTNYAICIDRTKYFTVSDIFFDFNYGNPVPVNMDGVHVDGNCHYGTIENLQGACYDDLVALNADEGSFGPITNITIRRLYATDCHSAVRMLTLRNRLENIHISDVYGTYYQYGIGLTRFYLGGRGGIFNAISLENIYISKAERYDIYQKKGRYVYAPIYVEANARVGALKIDTVHRREETTSIPTIYVGENATIENLVLSNIYTENEIGKPMPLFYNDGVINYLHTSDLDAQGDEVFAGERSVAHSRNG